MSETPMSNTDADAARTHEFSVDPVSNEPAALKRSLSNHLLYFVGKDPEAAQPQDWTIALSKSVRDHLVERWIATSRRQYSQGLKRVYYLSMEFLPGRMLGNGLLALGLYEPCRQAVAELGLDLETLRDYEPDPALGNGGLGRLAACLIDSLATLDMPGYAYGIRYDYGMFAQTIRDGYQIESPDAWLTGGHPWEFERPEVCYAVCFGGHVEHHANGARVQARWIPGEDIQAVAYDTLVPGYNTQTVLTLRLWSARASEEIKLSLFNQGQYGRAIEDKNRSENVSRVLYPDDSTDAGRELRLRQEYFFSSASLQDIIRRYLRPVSGPRRGLADLGQAVSIHLNDTHPAIAVAELMRLLVDEHAMAWADAWSICTDVFSYTNHTLMPEALETWPVDLVGGLLPRHLDIILAINADFLASVRKQFPGDDDLIRRVSLIDENGGRRVRMAHLAVVASHRINGVSALHSDLIRRDLFADFARLFPKRFVNVTNGVTPRRWLNQANPGLAALLDGVIDADWRTHLPRLADIANHASDPAFIAAFAGVKHHNKQRLAAHIKQAVGIDVDPASLFDVQIKRIHEYKRQLLNVLHVITRYHRMLDAPDKDWVARTVIFSGKAASSYATAKLIIKLIHDVAAQVNTDERLKGRLKVVFLPNYSVHEAELIIPAADLSEQISTAGTEASGTGNMKLALNGALTIGTEDGANIEIREQVGDAHIFMFGLRSDEVDALRGQGYDAESTIEANPELRRVLGRIGAGAFSAGEPGRFRPLVDMLSRYGDHYLLTADYADYLEAQDRVDAHYRDQSAWVHSAIINVARMGPFSSDRMARDYADHIWHLTPIDHSSDHASKPG
ncbi:MAG: glycogen/starch/alpha-glucan phosphorylase [Salinisphaera sp.]|jgi:starch phosphorylase|nr:glycogen/starch/alpha-glucan phosphorylase [Salinisphaera sp.]